ncbi:hemolysin-III related-domain-containing protein [Penicillium cf. viridicatum]|uniref:Hemolysin-III related-domain-containing protein n=1 Tax=Penicillium cf. viridicatum TaxID=2972119 RepID=A0A9W9SYU8_9EURO|nr:hemolysin-III related-domain-containing protein [Penicillium cf. viridicatum]
MPLQWDQLPSWQRDNQYILSGYRTSSNSFSKSFASLTYLHNESVNIYSHLIPAVILSFFGISIYKALARRYTSVSTADIIVFGCFFLGAVLCLGISATFHTVQNHSSHIARIANQLDYIGIVLLIVGSFIPSIFYGLFDNGLSPFSLLIDYLKDIAYISAKITSLGLLCAAISATPQFRHPTWRPFRARMFISLGLSALFPVVHGAMKFGIRQMNKQIGLFWVVLQGSLYIVGACIYASLMCKFSDANTRACTSWPVRYLDKLSPNLSLYGGTGYNISPSRIGQCL